jgi:hypothetical protein
MEMCHVFKLYFGFTTIVNLFNIEMTESQALNYNCSFVVKICSIFGKKINEQ